MLPLYVHPRTPVPPSSLWHERTPTHACVSQRAPDWRGRCAAQHSDRPCPLGRHLDVAWQVQQYPHATNRCWQACLHQHCHGQGACALCCCAVLCVLCAGLWAHLQLNADGGAAIDRWMALCVPEQPFITLSTTVLLSFMAQDQL